MVWSGCLGKERDANSILKVFSEHQINIFFVIFTSNYYKFLF